MAEKREQKRPLTKDEVAEIKRRRYAGLHETMVQRPYPGHGTSCDWSRGAIKS